MAGVQSTSLKSSRPLCYPLTQRRPRSHVRLPWPHPRLTGRGISDSARLNGPSPTRDQVHNALVQIAFVVVDMPRADDKARVAILRNLREIVSQGNFVRPWVVVDLDVLLKIGHRRMVHRQEDKVN